MNQATVVARRVVGLVMILAFLPQAALAQPEDIRQLKLRDWEPRSMLKRKITRVDQPAFPVIDVHNHLGGGAATLTEARVKRYLESMDEVGVQAVVNLDGGWDERLRETLAALDEAHPGRFLTFALINFNGFDEEGWSERETVRLRRSFETARKGSNSTRALACRIVTRTADGSRSTIHDSTRSGVSVVN